MLNNLNIEFNTFAEMLKKLPDDESCRIYLESKIWKNGTSICPNCNHNIHYKLKIKGEFNGLYKCALCRKRYTVP